MFVFWEIWCALFSWNTNFEIRPLPYYRRSLTPVHLAILNSIIYIMHVSDFMEICAAPAKLPT